VIVLAHILVISSIKTRLRNQAVGTVIGESATAVERIRGVHPDDNGAVFWLEERAH